jgi:hypothetical protein
MEHGRVLKRIWVLPVLVVVLIAAHGTAVYEVLSRRTWIVALGLIVLVLLMHIGGLGSIYAIFSRRFRHKS